MKSRLEIELTQNRLLSLHGTAQQLLMRYPNVAHVGVGIKEKNGRLTDDLSFRVYVHEKKSHDSLLQREIIPPVFMGFKTDVLLKQGIIRQADTTQYRPLTGGSYITNQYNTIVGGPMFPMLFSYGTLGCLARTVVGSKLVGLSAAHVLEDGVPIPMTSVGTQIGQPGISTFMFLATGHVGAVTVTSYASGLDCGIFEVDASNASLIPGIMLEDAVQDIGSVAGVAQAVCYEIVRKRGAATRLTQGIVVDVRFDNTNILITPCTDYVNFSEPGDSGAVIVNSANKVVGLLIGSSRLNPTQGVANHIQPVLTALGITIAGGGAATAGLVGVPAVSCSGGPTMCFGGLGSPTITESKNYFKALDDGTLFLDQQAAYTAEPAVGAGPRPLHDREDAIFGADSMRTWLAPYVFRDPNGWKEKAKINAIADPLVIPNASMLAKVTMLSTYQLDLLSSHFPGTGGAGSIDYDKVRITFERFMNGELRERPFGAHPYGRILTDGAREPNGSFEMMFAAFAWLCCENSIQRAKWEPLFNIYVQCQELFMCVYRRRPQVAPPANSIPIPAFVSGSAGNSLEPRTFTPIGGTARRVRVGETGFGDQGFSFDHFNLGPSTDTLTMQNTRLDATISIAQSGGARKAFLRTKYAAFNYDATKIAMKENIQRMLYMP